ncbi:MAG: ABC transporter permease [Longimicrobiales bacterium]
MTKKRIDHLADPGRRVRDVDDELAFHVEGRVAELVEDGWTEEDARAETLRRFGDLDHYRSECRAIAADRIVRERRGEIMGMMMQDVRFALRSFRRNPAFAFVAVLTLALGIGATTAVFTVAKNVVFDPLPFDDPDELVMVWEQNLSQNIARDNPSPPNYADWRRQNRSFVDLAAMQDGSMTLSDVDQPEVVQVAFLSPNTFDVLGVRPQRGRAFTPDDAADADAAPLALISDGLWKRRYGADPAIVGRTLHLNEFALEVAGVLPADFTVPRSDIDVWVPRNFENPNLHRQTRNLRVFGRLAEGVTPAQAKADLDVIQRRIAVDFPEANAGWTVTVVPAADEVVGANTRDLFLLLLGAVGFVLLIACANVANLLLGRSTSRQREISVRTALGASRARVVSQLLTESAVLGFLGGALGVGLAWGAVQGLLALEPQGLPRLEEVGVEGSSLLFATGVSVLTAFLFGLAPALHAVRGSVSETIKGASGTGSGSERTRSALVVAEVAVSLVLLVGAGLLLRSLVALGSVDPGFDSDEVAVARVSLGAQDYRSPESKIAYFDEMLRRFREIPGVQAAGLTSTLPMDPAGIDFDLPYLAEGQPARPEGELPQTDYRIASPGYFEAVGIEVLRGRAFNDLDRADGTPVLIINESLAEQLWPGQDPIGRNVTIYYVQDRPWQVVGVVEDTRHRGLGSPAPPQMFVPMAQAEFLFSYMHFAVKAGRIDASLVSALRQAGIEVDPKYPLYALSTLEQIVAATTQRDRFVATLLGTFALLALALAAVGIHGVVAYQVAQRTREIGLRMALGADRGVVLRRVLVRAGGLAGLGVVLGMAIAAGATRAVQGFLHDVDPIDPVTFLGVGVLLMAVACLAALIPGLRAARMDPAGALRMD